MSDERIMLGTASGADVKPVSWQKRKLMWIALTVFVVTGGLALLVNSTVGGYGLHWDYSISRYVGLETWSALVFAFGNVVVSGCMGAYLYYLAEIWQLPRWFNWLVILMVVTLIALSVCPIGYFDTVPGVKSVPTLVHEYSSRTMFLAMLIAAITFMLCGRASSRTRRASLYVAFFGVIFAGWYFFGKEEMANAMLILESLYLLGFMGLCLGCRSRGQTS